MLQFTAFLPIFLTCFFKYDLIVDLPAAAINDKPPVPTAVGL